MDASENTYVKYETHEFEGASFHADVKTMRVDLQDTKKDLEVLEGSALYEASSLGEILGYHRVQLPDVTNNSFEDVVVSNSGGGCGEAMSQPDSSSSLQNLSKAERTLRRQAGLEYFTKKGKMIQRKAPKYYLCQCHLNCKDTLSEEERRDIHRKFWELQSWNLQSNFISQTVVLREPKRRALGSNPSKKMFTRKYYLNDKQVCQKVYLATLDINHMRVDYILRHKRQEGGLCVPDKRGQTRQNDSSEDLPVQEIAQASNLPCREVPNTFAEIQEYPYHHFLEVNISTEVPASNIAVTDVERVVSGFERLGERMVQTEEESSNAKRLRKAERTIRRQAGLEYFTKNGKMVQRKAPKYYLCHCHLNCKDTLSEEERRDIHRKFWELQSWNLQSNFISQTVVLREPKRRALGSNPSKKMFTRKYFLNDKQVCQKVYLATLDINHMRVDYVLRHKQKTKGFCSPDQRGQATPNKTPQAVIDRINRFLDSIPKYHAQFPQSQKYQFHPDLTKVEIYRLYKQGCSTEEKPIGHTTFFKIFEEYIESSGHNLDTCQECESLNSKLMRTGVSEQKNALLKDLMSHHEQVNSDKKDLQMWKENCKQDPSFLCFSFGLAKAQPLPLITASVAYYKKQMLIYNLGINTFHNDQGYMCIWTEIEGRTGTNEVCSSILKFLEGQDLSGVEKIHSFSGCCGEHHKDEAFLSFLMWFLNISAIKEWQHTFVTSNHEHLPNDADFNMIERKKKFNFYLPEDWASMIKSSQRKRPLKVIRMKGEMKDAETLSKQRRFEVKSVEGRNFVWSELKWIQVEKYSSMVKYRTKNGDKINHIEFPLLRGAHMGYYLQPAYSTDIKLAHDKYIDLQSLLPYIPPIHHDYYISLPHE